MAGRAELKAKVTLDASPFRRGLARVRLAAKSLGRQMGPAIGRSMSAIGRTATAVSAAAVASLGAATMAAAKFGDQIDKTAARTGASTETVSAWAHAAELGGASVEHFEKAMAGMQRTLSDAKDGLQSAVREYDKLGLSIDELAKMSPDEQFQTIGNAIAGVQDASEKAAIAMAIFGRSGRQILPALGQDLAELKKEAEALGVLVTPEQAAAAAKLTDEISRLKASFKGVLLSGNVMKEATEMVVALREKIVELRKSGKFADFVAGVRQFAREVTAGTKAAIGAFRSLSGEQLDAFKRMALSAAGFVAAWKAGLVQPLLSMTATLAARIIAMLHPKVLLGGLVALPSFIAGLAIGKTLEKHFNLSGMILKAAEFAKAMAKMMVVMAANIANPFLKLGRMLSELFTTGQISDATADALLDAVNPRAVVDRLRKAGDDIGSEMQAAFDKINGVADDAPEGGFFENLKEQLEKDFAGIPERIAEMVEKLKNGLGGALGIDVSADALAQFAAEFKRLRDEHLNKPAGDPMKEVGDGAAGAAAQVAKLKNLLAGFRGGLIRSTAEGATTPGMRAAAAARATPGAAILAAVKNRLAGGPGRQPIAAAVRPAMQRSTDRMADKLLAVAQQGVQHLGNIDRKGVIMGWT